MTQTAEVTAQAVKKRAVSKEMRRAQLIKATIKCVARKGLSGTTMADITKEAGLSLGIVNLHFQSKDKLLVETLRYMSEEYGEGVRKALDAKGGPAEKLQALLEMDFSAKVCQRNKLAVWFAFWGESKSRPTYQKLCAKIDADASAAVHKLFHAINDEGQYQHVDPGNFASVWNALTEGLWLDILISPNEVNREKALNICQGYLASIFPNHFNRPTHTP